ncbi:hypothetical protein BH160DRAFT_1511 [Burkholderia sp. H160]|nr:hypothetical protein BH160DRAFT_1511 [Burkholderia sp. H160]
MVGESITVLALAPLLAAGAARLLMAAIKQYLRPEQEAKTTYTAVVEKDGTSKRVVLASRIPTADGGDALRVDFPPSMSNEDRIRFLESVLGESEHQTSQDSKRTTRSAE